MNRVPGAVWARPHKERSDRQLTELLNELRVALPGAQVLLAFLLAVPFATRFGRVDEAEKVALFIALIGTVAGTVLLMAPPVYHRLRWGWGGKTDVVEVASRLFLAGTGLLGLGMVAAVYLVSAVLYGSAVAIVATCLIGVVLVLVWYLLPLRRASRPDIRERE
jgi:hypothetical protein